MKTAAMNDIPSRADVVIIGGGIIGASIAYHLTKIGITHVVLLERRQLTCGTTWHAAGLVPQLRATRTLTELAKYTSELLHLLEAETGQATGFKQNGSVAVALSQARLEEFKRTGAMGRAFGVHVDFLSPAEVLEKYPLLDGKGVVGGLWTPNDGQTNPIDTTQAYAKGAKQRGAKIFENTLVTDIVVENGRAVGVQFERGTDHGELRAPTVVLACGMWSAEIGRKLGIRLALQAAEHFYIVTEPMARVPKNLPVLRVPDECAYYKEDAGKLLLGAFERVAKPWALDGIPKDFFFDELPQDFDHFEPILSAAMERVPVLQTTGIATWFNGPESFTPDDRYLLGETAEVRDLFVACGFNSIGIQSSGGAGKVLAEWIRDRHAPIDLPGMDVRRMHPCQGTKAYLADRTTESLGLLYQMHWPFRQVESARGARRTAFHDRLVAMGACMGELSGWERANWYAQPGSAPKYEYSFGRQNWFKHTADECAAVMNRVALFDQSSMAKFIVQGRDACKVLNRLCTADVDVGPGRVVYTQWLNERGGIESDLTVTRLAEDRYMVVTAVSSHIRDLAYLREHVGDAFCTVTDVTSGTPMLGLMGPNSRALLQELTGADLSNEAFKFARSAELEIGYAIVRAQRITYVGELGWELYIPAEFALHVFERVIDAGAKYGLKLAGFHAMNACRTEKSYLHWGHDVGIEDTPIEAGVEFTCAHGKAGGYIGRDAVLRQKELGAPHKRLLQFKLADANELVYHEEPIFADGKPVGVITSGMYGHRVQASLGMGYAKLPQPVTAEVVAGTRWEIGVGDRRVPAVAQLRAWYDPKNERIRA
ncbi:FAD-dependent oxidoreductase [Ideonella sp. A 288]|uniref:GcvT family protein n=1 Tax=Ideonella sp. A 288 TaxID=1962181 RepID=UPI001F1DBF18|nr:FAD-dependent oxidoreductase [Ideonella sp. A 288]